MSLDIKLHLINQALEFLDDTYKKKKNSDNYWFKKEYSTLSVFEFGKIT